MSKRGAEGQGGEERYGAYGGQAQSDDMADRPHHATAAQMARRKIAGLKGTRRPRSESPLTNTSSVFEQATQNGLLGNAPSQPPSNPFSNTPSFSFGGGNASATNGTNTPSFGSGGSSFGFGLNNTQPKPAEQPAQGSNFSFTFGGGNNTASNSFAFGQNQASSTPPQSNGFNPTPSFSFGQPQPQTNGNAPNGLFGAQQAEQSAKPASTSTFGNAFGAAQAQDQPTKPKETNFGGQQEKQSSQPPANNLFSSFGNKQPEQNGNAKFTFGNKSSEFGGRASSETPAASSANPFAGFGQKSQPNGEKSAAPSKEPAANGWASFLDKAKPTETTKPATSLFAQTPQTNGTDSTSGTAPAPSIFSGLGQSQSQTPTFKFAPQTQQAIEDDDASMISPENTPHKPKSGLVNGATSNGPTPAAAESTTPEAPVSKGPSLFDRITRDPPKEFASGTPAPPKFSFGSTAQPPPASAPPKSLFQPSKSLFGASPLPQSSDLNATQATARPHSGPSVTPAEAQPSEPSATAQQSKGNNQTSMASTTPESFTNIRELNESLLQHLKTQDVSRDWSSIFEYYTKQAAALQGKPTKQLNASPDKKDPATTPGFGQQTAASTSSSSALPANNVFGQAAQPPASKPASTGFGNSIFRKSTTTPSQPTSSLFSMPPATAPAKEKSSATDSAGSENRRKSVDQADYPKLPDNASETAKLFQATLDKPTTASAKPSTFNPSVKSLFAQKALDTSAANKSVGSVAAPASGGFTPTFTPNTASSGGSFLSAFGEQAKKTADKDKKRRRDEDFDSDEENEEEWEKRDAEEQAKKRAKFEEAAKSASGFSFKASETPSKSASFSFGNPAAKSSENEQSGQQDEAGDHTWKQGTPIKFGGIGNTAASTTPAPTPAPKLGLFGAPVATPSLQNGTASLFANFGKPAQSSSAFTFGQPANATAKPTDTSTAKQNGEESTKDGDDEEAAPAEPQMEDMTALLPSELDESDVLYHVEKAKARKLESRPSEDGTDKLTWVEKGVGPIWILRNKTTQKSRVLLKVPPYGKPAMNFAVIKGSDKLYRHEGMKGRGVLATFIDHFDTRNPSTPSQWAVVVGKEEDAAEIARVLKEEQKNA